MRLKTVTATDIPFGRLLPFALLDADGNVLIAAGELVGREQFSLLEEFSVYRDADWTPESTPDNPAGPNNGLPAPPPITPYDLSEKLAGAGKAGVLRAPRQQDGVQYLRMNFKGASEGFFVRLYGMVPEQSLLIAAPTEKGRLVFVKEGDIFDFKGFYSRVIYSFSAAIQQVCFQPFPYLHRRIQG